MRLMDADELLKAPFRITGNFGGKYPFEAITVKMVEAAPTINPIHAAGGCYCRECKYLKKITGLYRACERHSMMIVQENDFCSYGEARGVHNYEAIDAIPELPEPRPNFTIPTPPPRKDRP